MKKAPLLILASLLLLAGCVNKNSNTSKDDSDSRSETSQETSSEESSSEEVIEDLDVDIETNVAVEGKSKRYSETFTYNSAYFEDESSSFNKNIALLSYGLSSATQSREAMYNFLGGIRFKDIYLSPSFYADPTEDSIGYAFSHKQISKEQHLLIVSIRGFNYGAEWSNNFDLGKEGNHAGFTRSASTILEDLDKYIVNHSQQSSKLLITGYSRGGAVANVLSDMLFRRETDKKLIKDENVYTYTFEAPKGLVEKVEYENVFNVINDMDPIPLIAPEQYGFYRCGIDVNIGRSDIDEFIKKYDETYELPAFTPNEEEYQNEQEFASSLIDKVVTYDSEERPVKTRKQFVDNAQGTFQYFMSMFFSLKDSTVDSLKTYLTTAEMWDLLPIIASGEGMHDFFKPYLDEDGYQYDDAELLEQCTALQLLLTAGPGLIILSTYLASADNLTRAINMHYPEINFALLKAYDPDVK